MLEQQREKNEKQVRIPEPKLELWTMRPGDHRLRDLVERSVLKALEARPEVLTGAEYFVDWPDYFDFLKRDKLNPRTSCIIFVIGETLDELQGIATCIERGPWPDRKVKSACDIGRDTDVMAAPGYRDYQGQGKILHLGSMEVFVRGEGRGRRFLNSLKSLDYELIEVDPYPAEACGFFKREGFIDTGIISYSSEQNVFVWNNPRFCVGDANPPLPKN